MAKKIKSYDWEGARRKRNEDGYPWDEWLNGEIWQISKADLLYGPISIGYFQNTVRTAAKKRGLKVRCSYPSGAEVLTIQAYSPSENLL